MPWFFIVVEGDLKREALIAQQGYYAFRPRLGEAIDSALADAATLPDHLEDRAPVYVAWVDESEMDGELYETDSPDLLMSDGLSVRPVSEGRSFVCPAGIVPTGWQPDGIDRETIREGFVTRDDSHGFALEAQLEGGRLRTALESLIQLVPTVDTLVVTLIDHYDNIERVDGPVLIENAGRSLVKEVDLPPLKAVEQLSYLEQNVLDNGHVDFGVHSERADSTLWMTEHKTIHAVTSNPEMRERMAGSLAKELKQHEQLQMFSNWYSHVHYRRSESLDADRLTEWLLSDGWCINEPEG